MPPSQYEPGQLLPGTVYRVIRHLATGGMGSVYDVEDTTVEKRYVLKTLHPQLVAREDLARRMRDEAKSLAKLQHPNIVDVITAGVTQDALKVPFYVMERLIGQNLRVVLEKKSVLEVTHSYRIAIDIADALEHAHENNLVHRDVKPENIFLHRNANGTTTTKLLDFGIVRLLDRKTSHTHGKFIGTLRYASPEQITGKEVGPPTDIYSLGLVLFEMLCGRGPFDDAGDQYAIGAAHAGQPAPPLSRFVAATADVERLVASMLAKDPAHRPRDCFAVATELRRILRGVEASPRSETAVNVLSAAASSANGSNVSTHTSALDAGATVHGMIPPSSPDVSGSPDTAILGPQASGSEKAGPVSPIAPTLAAAGLAERDAANVQIVAPGYGRTPHGSASRGSTPHGSGPLGPAPRVIDRDAPTRASAPSGATQRLAPNDTRIESPLANDDDVRAAFGEPAPLVVPPLGGSNPSGDIIFPPMRAPTGTGPLSGEARTRPPERGPVILVVVAAVLSVAMVGGAYLLVRKPWQSSSALGVAPGTGTGTATTTATATASEIATTTVTPTTPASTPSAPVPPPSPTLAATATTSGATVNGAPPRSDASTAATVTKTAAAPTSASRPKPSSPAGSGYSPAVKFE